MTAFVLCLASVACVLSQPEAPAPAARVPRRAPLEPLLPAQAAQRGDPVSTNDSAEPSWCADGPDKGSTARTHAEKIRPGWSRAEVVAHMGAATSGNAESYSYRCALDHGESLEALVVFVGSTVAEVRFDCECDFHRVGCRACPWDGEYIELEPE